MKKALSFCVILFVLSLTCSTLLAGPDAASFSGNLPSGSPGKLSEKLRFIPYSDLQQVFEKNPKWVILARDQYETMKEAKEAFLAKTPASSKPLLEADFVFGVGEFRGVVREEFAEFEWTQSFSMPNDRWAFLPLPAGDICLAETLIDGKQVGAVSREFSGIQDSESPQNKVMVMQQKMQEYRRSRRKAGAVRQRVGQNSDYFLVVREPGEHVLKVRFLVPLSDDPEKKELTFRTPRVPLSVFHLTLEKPDLLGEVDRSEGTSCQTDKARSATVVDGTLGNTDRFTLRWAPKVFSPQVSEEPVAVQNASDSGKTPVQVTVAKVEEKPRMYADSYTLISVGEGYIRNETIMRFNITRAPKGTIQWLLPAGQELLEVRSPRLDSYKIERLPEGSRVICRLNAKVAGALEVSFTGETRMEETQQQIVLPLHHLEEAERDRGFVGLEPRTSIEIRKTEEESAEDGEGVSWMDVSELPEEVSSRAIRPMLLGFRYNRPPATESLKLQVTWHRDYPVLYSTVDRINATTLLENDGNSFTSMELTMKNNGRQFLEVTLPKDYELLSANLDSTPIIPSMKDSKEKNIRLVPLTAKSSGSTPKTEFKVNMVFQSHQKPLENLNRLSLPLPVLNVPSSYLEWSVYGPERFDFIPLSGKITPAFRRTHLGFFHFVEGLYQVVFSGPVLLLLMMMGVVYLVWRALQRHSVSVMEGGSSPWSAASWAFIILVVVVIGIAGLTASGGSRSAMFDSIQTTLAVPQSPMVMNAPGAMPQESDEYAAKGYEGKDKASMDMPSPPSGMASNEEKRSEPPRMKTGKADFAKKPMPSFRVRASRDAGAKPVEITIPTTANVLIVEKPLILADEEVILRTALIWEPWVALARALLGLAGILFFLFFLWLARGGHSWLASGSFLSVAVALQILEQLWPGSQWPMQSVFMLCFLIYLLVQTARVFGRRPSAGVAVVLFLLVPSFPPAWCEELTLDPRVEQTIDVYVPFQQLPDKLPRESGLVFLKFDEYQYLRDLGVPKPDPSRWLPPAGVTYGVGTLTGRIVEDHVEIHLRAELTLLGKGFKHLEFPCQGLGVRQILLNGKPARLIPDGFEANPQNDMNQQGQAPMQQMRMQMNQMNAPVQQSLQMDNLSNMAPNVQGRMIRKAMIISEEEGQVVLEADLLKDLNTKNEPNAKVIGFRMPLPPLVAARFELLIPRSGQRVEVTPGVVVERRSESNQTFIAAYLQPGPELSVEWRDLVAVAEPEPQDPITASGAQAVTPTPALPQIAKVVGEHETLISIADGAILFSDLIHLTVEQAPVGELVFQIPSGTEVMSVSGGDVASWKAENATDSQLIRVRLNAQRQDRFDIQIDSERPAFVMNGRFPLDLARLLEVSPKGTVDRERWMLAVENLGGFAVSAAGISPDNFCDAQNLPEPLRQRVRGFLAHAMKFLQAPEAFLEITKHREVAVTTAQIRSAYARTQVTVEGKAITRLGLSVANNNNQFLVIPKLPTKTMRLLSVLVDGEAIKPGSDPSGMIFIPLVRSPRTDQGYQPFSVVLYLEDLVRGMNRPGKVDLYLPQLSVDISAMNWQVELPMEVTFFKVGGVFEPGGTAISALPQKFSARNSAQNQMRSNVQVPLGKSMEGNSGLLSALVGRLPVEPVIPGTFNVQVFHKRLVLGGGEAPRLVLFQVKEVWLQPMFVAFVLLLGFLTAGFAGHLRRGETTRAGFLLFLILGSGGLLLMMQNLFGMYLPFLPRLELSYLLGIKTGLVLFLSWWVLSSRPAPETPGVRIPPAPKAVVPEPPSIPV